MEQIGYNPLFRGFVGFSTGDKVWGHPIFTRNRDRLLEGDIARRFLVQVFDQAKRAGLLSREHFSMDGTLIEAKASLKSYRPKDESEILQWMDRRRRICPSQPPPLTWGRRS